MTGPSFVCIVWVSPFEGLDGKFGAIKSLIACVLPRIFGCGFKYAKSSEFGPNTCPKTLVSSSCAA